MTQKLTIQADDARFDAAAAYLCMVVGEELG